MAYTALPDRRIPYDNDGTVVYWYANSNLYAGDCFNQGPQNLLSQANAAEINDADVVAVLGGYPNSNPSAGTLAIWWFFPETREVTGIAAWENTYAAAAFAQTLQGSVNSTNGMDGTWETASLPSGIAYSHFTPDRFRNNIKPVSFTGGKSVIRNGIGSNTGGGMLCATHLYGEKIAGQTPDDIIYINHDDTPGAEFTAPEDFGDQPLGTTVVRQFRVKNTSATKTANTINIQCNDADFAISEDSSTWVVTINISSLAAGAESATLYVRCTTPAPGSVLGPRFARIVTTVGSYT